MPWGTGDPHALDTPQLLYSTNNTFQPEREELVDAGASCWVPTHLRQVLFFLVLIGAILV